MNSTEKLNLVFDMLGASNSEIAKISGIDPSLISRYRSGSRQPSLTSKQFLMLCDGIAKYATQKGLWEKMGKLYGSTEAEFPIAALQEYLCMTSNTEPSNSNNEITSTTIAVNGFADKLNLIMDVLNVSNVMLAKAICIDTSLVSRLKTGKRIPKKSGDLINSISMYFLKRIKSLNLVNHLSIALGIPSDLIEKGSDEFIQMFSNWLLSTPDTMKKDPYYAKTDLQLPDPMFQSKHEPDMNLIANIKTPMKTTKFFGNEGIQNAMIALMNKINATDTPHLMKFFNDNNSDWLLNASPSYMATLSYLFRKSNQNKTKYQIIHNCNRSTEAISLGIQKWLPMYMTGLVEGYYYTSSPSEKFHHTLIIVQDTAAIFSSHVVGTENDSVYFYTEDMEIISYLEFQFNALLERSKPLTSVVTRSNYENYHLQRTRLSNCSGDVKTLFKSPLMNTMPHQLFSRMINTKSLLLSNAQKTKLIDFQATFRTQLERRLKTSRVVEYIYFPDFQEVVDGKVMLNLAEFLVKEQIPYSVEEFAEHIRYLIQLLKHENYHIVPLNGYPNESLSLCMVEPSDVLIFVNSELILPINHPELTIGFDAFLKKAVSNYMLPCKTKEDVINLLNQYVHIAENVI